jgi:hypothetical protein
LKEAVKYPQISAITVQEPMLKPKNSEQPILGRENFKDFDLNVKTEERSYSDKKLIPIQTTFKPRKKKGVEL